MSWTQAPKYQITQKAKAWSSPVAPSGLSYIDFLCYQRLGTNLCSAFLYGSRGTLAILENWEMGRGWFTINASVFLARTNPFKARHPKWPNAFQNSHFYTGIRVWIFTTPHTMELMGIPCNFEREKLVEVFRACCKGINLRRTAFIFYQSIRKIRPHRHTSGQSNHITCTIGKCSIHRISRAKPSR